MEISRQVMWGASIILAIIFSVVLGVLGPFNGGTPEGGTTTEIFLPAGYVFSIWGVIYLGLIGLGVWLMLPAQALNPRAVAAAPWLFATAFGNLLWIFFAGTADTVIWTWPTLVFMQITAWVAYFRLGIGGPSIAGVEQLLRIPVQVYVGWLSVATIANLAAVLNILGWDGFGLSPVTWALVMLIIGTAVGLTVYFLVQDQIYLGVFIWAFIGIMVLQVPYPSVVYTAGVMAALIGGVLFYSNFSTRMLLVG